VKKGGAYAGTHCATDTLYKSAGLRRVGRGVLREPPLHQKIKLKVEDRRTRPAKPFEGATEITDEIYQFKDTLTAGSGARDPERG